MKNEQRTLRLNSEPQSLNKLEVLIQDVCDEYKLENTHFGCISVAVTEAFQNALVHGNKNDVSKQITISFEKTASGLNFSVEDEGPGFNYSGIPDVKDDGKEKTFPGRGLFLIKSLCDEVVFNEKGNMISLGFKTSGINIETAIKRQEQFDSIIQPDKQLNN